MYHRRYIHEIFKSNWQRYYAFKWSRDTDAYEIVVQPEKRLIPYVKVNWKYKIV